MKNKDQMGKALGRVPSGLFIITARNGDQEDAVLASWVSQCSFEPPAITIVLAQNRPARGLIEASGAYIVNVISNDTEGLLKTFCKKGAPDASIFNGLAVKKGYKDIAILADAVSYLECKVINHVAVGDHVIYIGEIVGGDMLNENEQPYIHTRSSGFSY